MPTLKILLGDCAAQMRLHLEAESVQCCVTSPPYFGLRNYGMDGQIGIEKSPAEYVARLVEVFGEVHRVLRNDGTLWLNLGDSYCSQSGTGEERKWRNGSGRADGIVDERGQRNRNGNKVTGLKPKDLVGIPWMVAFALRDAGWYLRSDIIWAKPNPMPESVTDRPTRSHEYIFMLTKSPRYYYNAEAIKEPPSPALIQQVEEGYNGHALKDYNGSGVQDASGTKGRIINGMRAKIDKQRGHSRRHAGFNDRWDKLTHDEKCALGSNKRSVWNVAPANFKDAHFATFPPELIKPCIMAGSKPGDMILDPFGGSGTTGMVALELGRSATLIELNPGYVKLIEQRCHVTPGMAL